MKVSRVKVSGRLPLEGAVEGAGFWASGVTEAVGADALGEGAEGELEEADEGAGLEGAGVEPEPEPEPALMGAGPGTT